MIGVLNLQGGVVEHLDHLKRLSIPCIPVKDPVDFHKLSGLIIPGGESTCMSRLMRIFGIEEVILREFKRGMKIWGTCAGTILLAKSIVGEPSYLSLIDIEIERNSFGSQLDSFVSEACIPQVAPHVLPLTFIRAPKITRAGEGVDVLLRMQDYIAAAESPNVLVTVFHPELTGCVAFHRYFAKKCGFDSPDHERISAVDPAWNSKSWTRQARITRH
jgi:pyridoxal 5'-phosphate synthase pdxT subunit